MSYKEEKITNNIMDKNYKQIGKEVQNQPDLMYVDDDSSDSFLSSIISSILKDRMNEQEYSELSINESQDDDCTVLDYDYNANKPEIVEDYLDSQKQENDKPKQEEIKTEEKKKLEYSRIYNEDDHEYYKPKLHDNTNEQYGVLALSTLLIVGASWLNYYSL